MTVSEIFYSLQGEGGRAGEPSLFVRLSGCSVQFACMKSGVVCDTEFVSGREMTREEILAELRRLSPTCRWIVWTGGEPTDQLTAEDVAFFADENYEQAIETSGVRPVPDGLDWVTISPKVAEHILAKHFPEGCTELKYVRAAGQAIPAPALHARHYYLSPHADGDHIHPDTLKAVIALCLAHPRWRLSLQQHKLWRVR
jgi:organic radical activating enzyme